MIQKKIFLCAAVVASFCSMHLQAGKLLGSQQRKQHDREVRRACSSPFAVSRVDRSQKFVRIAVASPRTVGPSPQDERVAATPVQIMPVQEEQSKPYLSVQELLDAKTLPAVEGGKLNLSGLGLEDLAGIAQVPHLDQVVELNLSDNKIFVGFNDFFAALPRMQQLVFLTLDYSSGCYEENSRESSRREKIFIAAPNVCVCWKLPDTARAPEKS